MHKDLQAAGRRAELAEIRAADLSEEVARARLVGRAAMQALAMSKLDTVAREPRLGWRQAMRRLFGMI